MSNASVPSEHPADQLRRLTTRTLWVLYGAFWAAVIVYAAVILVLLRPGAAGGPGSGAIGLAPAASTLEIVFLAAGAVCLYLAFRLGGALLRPARLWQGEQSVEGLAARLTQHRTPASGPGQGAAAERGSPLADAVQHVVGRTIVAHLIAWVIAEVPALLGLLDRFLSGPHGMWPVLIALSVVGLLLRRPSGQRLREIFDPIYRVPFKLGNSNGAAPPGQ